MSRNVNKFGDHRNPSRLDDSGLTVDRNVVTRDSDRRLLSFSTQHQTLAATLAIACVLANLSSTVNPRCHRGQTNPTKRRSTNTSRGSSRFHNSVLPLSCPTTRATFRRIHYSDRYSDDQYEYRHVILPKPLFKLIPKSYFNDDETGTLRLLADHEWRGIGIQQSLGWVHYEIHGMSVILQSLITQKQMYGHHDSA